MTECVIALSKEQIGSLNNKIEAVASNAPDL